MEDFLVNFDYLDVCHVLETPSNPGIFPGNSVRNNTSQSSTPYTVSRYFGQWIRGVTAGGRPFIRASHWANPQFVMVIPSPDTGDPEGSASVIIALLQSDSRPLRHRAPRLLSIGFVLYRVCFHC